MIDLDRAAARRATIAAVLAMAVALLLQGAVSAAVTGGQQPLGVTEQVPQTTQTDQWADAPSRTVSLSKQQMAVPFGGGSVDEMQVQALTNDTHVAVRLQWRDPTNDSNIAAPENYSDAAAVMLRSGEQPPIMMGASGQPVNIWYWRAQWQYGADARAEWSGDMYSYLQSDNETKPGQAAGNPLSRARYDEFGQNYYAAGFGSLTHASAQNVDAHATRENDTWSVVFVREHETSGEHDAAFSQDEPMYMAFAAWNGSAGEVNGKKSLTLQFSTLNTSTGQLAAADTGGSGDGGSGTATDGGSSGASAGSGLFGFVGLLVGAAAISWTVVYWRSAR